MDADELHSSIHPARGRLSPKLTASLLRHSRSRWRSAAARLSRRGERRGSLALGAGTNLWATSADALAAGKVLRGHGDAVDLTRPWRACAISDRRNAAGSRRMGPASARPDRRRARALDDRAMGRARRIAIVDLCGAAVAVAINVAWFGHPLGAVPLLGSMHPTLRRRAPCRRRRGFRQPVCSSVRAAGCSSSAVVAFAPVVSLPRVAKDGSRIWPGVSPRPRVRRMLLLPGLVGRTHVQAAICSTCCRCSFRRRQQGCRSSRAIGSSPCWRRSASHGRLGPPRSAPFVPAGVLEPRPEHRRRPLALVGLGRFAAEAPRGWGDNFVLFSRASLTGTPEPVTDSTRPPTVKQNNTARVNDAGAGQSGIFTITSRSGGMSAATPTSGDDLVLSVPFARRAHDPVIVRRVPPMACSKASTPSLLRFTTLICIRENCIRGAASTSGALTAAEDELRGSSRRPVRDATRDPKHSARRAS